MTLQEIKEIPLKKIKLTHELKKWGIDQEAHVRCWVAHMSPIIRE